MFRQIINWVTYHILRRPVGGLYDERDEQNFGARVIAGEITKDDLTEEEFQTCDLALKHQGSTDMCVGFSKGYAKEATELKIMSGAGAFAMGCRARGWFTGWGISILQVMKGGVKYGVPEERLWNLKMGTRNFLANWCNMSQLVLDNAKLHRDKSYFEIWGNSEMDRFDQIRAYLNKFRNEKIVIQSGIDAHAATFIGQEMFEGELCIFGPDSYGNRNYNYRYGKCVDGYRYFTRKEANLLFVPYFATDIPRSLAELLHTYDGKAVKLENANDCYLVDAGRLRLLKNETIAWSHNTLLFGEDYVYVLTEDEFRQIPKGKQAIFSEGANHEIVRRILEKTGRTDLIDEA